jgi:hypothetical protein
MNKPNILFLADTTHHTKAVTDHIQAITSGDQIHWHVVNPLICKTIDKLDFSLFDAIGLHYSVKPYNNYYLSRLLKKRIAAFKGTKFLFLQDEYQKVNQVQEFLYSLGFNILFTLVNNKIVEKAYPDPRLSQLKKITVLTGYVSEDMKSIIAPPITGRKFDVTYRGRPCDYWLGKLAHDKQLIATEFIKHTVGSGLKVDISLEESARLYGDAWLQLLMNSKAVLGTESGASIWDFDETIQKKTKQYLKKNKSADFNAVYEAVLKPYDSNILYNAISPRVFEAAATKTPMVMFPGEYSGICKPDTHYIVLEKDFSNIEDVLKKLKDVKYLQALADRTYEDLIASGLYSQHVFSNLVSEELLAHIKNSKKNISASEISFKIEEGVKKHKHLNQFRCLYTESSFIICNFLRLLFDPRYTFFSKIETLVEGMRRYTAYLLPRLKKEE